MKTKEEILKQYESFRFKTNELDEIHYYIDNVLLSMQEYADEQSIAFADWISENWTPNGRKGCWDSNELNSKKESKYLIDSTTEILQIFKNENK